jgi:hypothetical protein
VARLVGVAARMPRPLAQAAAAARRRRRRQRAGDRAEQELQHVHRLPHLAARPRRQHQVGLAGLDRRTSAKHLAGRTPTCTGSKRVHQDADESKADDVSSSR